MQYKFYYRFTIEGFNKETEKREILEIITQYRNIGIDHQLYKLLRTESYSFCETHSGITVTIMRGIVNQHYGNIYYERQLEYVGTMFFEKYKWVSHRSFFIHDDNGKTRSCFVFSWR